MYSSSTSINIFHKKSYIVPWEASVSVANLVSEILDLVSPKDFGMT